MRNKTNMAELMKKVNAHGQPQNLDEGFASDAQRRAAFAQGYKAKGKKDKKDEEVLDEAKATLSRFGGDRLKSSIMNLAKQKGLKVKDLGKDKIEISGNGKVVMALTLAVQKKDVKINEGPPDTQTTPDVSAMRAAGKENELPKIKAKAKQMVAVAGKEEVDIQEDGHTDVASAIRQCKTIVEDAMQITSKLQTMNPEDSLPSWWTNKLAVSSNSMNKLRDYFLVPTTEEVELEEKSEYGPDIRGEISQLQKMLKGLERGKKTPGRGFAKMRIKELIAALEKRQAQDDAVMKLRGEEVELDEAAGDLSDMKKLIGELQNASKMHLAQSKRVKAHVDMMKGSIDLEPIVGELEKASQAHQRQSKTIDAHIKGMKEYIEDELDEKFDYVLLDKDNKIVGRYSGKDAKKNAQSDKNSAHLPPMRIPKGEVSKMKVYPISPKDKKGIGDMVLAIGEEVKLTEKIEYVEYKFKNSRDASSAKSYFDGIQLMKFDVNDDNISNGELMVDAGNKDMTKYHKEVMKKFRPKVMVQEKKLTDAEMKKREEIAKAIEKDDPDMPMDKKMAIATATAKRVAEEEEPEKPDTAKQVDQMRDDKKKTRIAQLQLQIAKATETINKLNTQEK